ncbi:hypothetical protein KKD03_05465 [Patescibacteria group bacterium]|nr:hypothetical protein [Patescibacteria group bacterium]
MENKIQQNIQPFQPLPQTPVPTPPTTNCSKILLFSVFGLVVVATSVYTGIQIGKTQTPSQQPITTQPTAPLTQASENQITIIGVVRTSGLNEDEKQKLGLSSVTYQLTDFNQNDKQDLYGYYLISSDETIETLLGKCVQITGVKLMEWKNKNIGDSYLRTAFVLNSINPVDNLKCNPYSITPVENVTEAERLTLRGVANNSDRPAPDINYDYQIKLSKSFLDKENSSGSPQQVSLVDAIPDTNDVWITLTDNINREVEIQGYMEWGYSESKYFRITSIKSVQ